MTSLNVGCHLLFVIDTCSIYLCLIFSTAPYKYRFFQCPRLHRLENDMLEEDRKRKASPDIFDREAGYMLPVLA